MSLFKINLTGGIVSPGTLSALLACASEVGVSKFRFGLRQQLFFQVANDKIKTLTECLDNQGLDFEVDTDVYPNIISSYCAEEVFPTGQWLSEGIYKDIFDEFDYKPLLKINISDNAQSFTPFFTGNLNFIASPIANFWYLYVRPKQSNHIFCWHELIFTNQIPNISKLLENQLLNSTITDERILQSVVAKAGDFITRPIENSLSLPRFTLPYYEGFNRYGDRTWLGIYRREEHFSLQFLQDICQLCLDTRIGQLCITPWKSLIIKGIENKDRMLWDKLLGKHGINVRHAANELNWQIEDNSDDGLSLKKQIIREFDAEDVRTFGLCFAIQTRPKSEVFGSVIIKKSDLLSVGGSSLLSSFDIYHTEDFNPNNRKQILFQKNISKLNLSEQIRRLTKKYYAYKFEELSENVEPAGDQIIDKQEVTLVHQCPHCFTIYDDAFGDILNNIPAGIPFEQLPNTYQCPTCETPKYEFFTVERELMVG